MKFKKNDQIQVMSGKDRGKQGKIEKVFTKEEVVLVRGVGLYKKHRKSQGENRPGEILTLERPIATSKLALVCPKCNALTRVGYLVKNDKKTRVCKKCKGEIN